MSDTNEQPQPEPQPELAGIDPLPGHGPKLERAEPPAEPADTDATVIALEATLATIESVEVGRLVICAPKPNGETVKMPLRPTYQLPPHVVGRPVLVSLRVELMP